MIAERLTTAQIDLDEMLAQIVARTREIIPFDSGGIAIFDPASGFLVPRSFQNATPSAPLPRLLRVGEGIAGLAAQLRQPMLVDDGQSDTRYIPYDPDTRAQLAVPIILNDELLGVFSVESKQTATYNRQHQIMLYALADQAALALHTARVYGELAKRYERLNEYNEELLIRNEISRMSTSDQPIEGVLPQIAERLARLIKADACAFVLWDEKHNKARRLTASGIDLAEYLDPRHSEESVRSLTREVVTHGRPIILNDAHRIDPPPTTLVQEFKVKSVIAMPLKARGRTIGATYLFNTTEGRPFTKADGEYVASVLDQIALAIDNGILLKDTQERRSETSVLLEIAAIASSSLELDALLEQVIRLSQRMLGVTAGAVLIYDRQNNVLVTRSGAMFGLTEDFLSYEFPVNDFRSKISVVFTSGSGVVINDMSSTNITATGSFDNFRELVFRDFMTNLMIAPLRVQDEPVGVFFVANKMGGFTRGDLDLLVAMGSHVAAALRNADLLDATRSQLQETRTLQRISAFTSATFDLDDMLRKVITEAAGLLDVEGAFLYLPDESEQFLSPHFESLYGTMTQTNLPTFSINDAEAIVVQVYQMGAPYLSNYPMPESPFTQRNLIAYPLTARGKSRGVLAMINRRSGEFDDIHGELMRAIAGQIAVSMENVGLFNAERRRADLMATISKISQELTATLDLPALMRKVTSSIHEMLGFEAVCIYLLDESGAYLTTQSSVASTASMLIPEGNSFPITQGVTGRAVRLKKSQLVVNLRQDPDFFWPGDYSFRSGSGLAVLLRNRERISGVIGIVSTRIGSFREPDVIAMETLATQVSTVIENARLWDQAQRRLLEQGIVHQIGQDLTSILEYGDLVNAVVRHMTRALGTAICLLINYNSEAEQITVDAEYRTAEIANSSPANHLKWLGQPPGEVEHWLAQKALLTRRPVVRYIGDADASADHRAYFERSGITAEMAIPMIAGDRAIGCMMWIEVGGQRRFSKSDIQLAETLITQAAIAIENARLYQQAQRQAREQAMLRSVAVRLSLLSGMDELLRIFPREVIEVMSADNVLLALRDPDQIFRVKGQVLNSRRVDQMLLGRIHGWLPSAWRSLSQGLTLMLSSSLSTENPALVEIRTLMSDQEGVLAIVPIMRRNEAIGIIEVCRDDAMALFDSQEIALLESLASQGSTAIDNISLYEREQFRLHQLEKVQTSGRVLSGQLNMDKLIEMIVTEAATIFDCPAVSLIVPGETEFKHRAAYGLSDRYLSERRLSLSLASASGPAYIPDITALPGTPPDQLELVIAESLKSVLGVPLIKAGERIGWVLLYSKTRVRHFSEEEIELAQLFAGQAAVAMENARLFQQLEDRAIELGKANRLKSEFLARVSHELRTPMNSINGYSELLLRGTYTVLNDKQSDRVERILRNGRNLLALIDDLLDLSKIDAGKMELRLTEVNIYDELNAVLFTLEQQATTRGLYLRAEVSQDLPLVRVDSIRLRQVITNLLGNAIKFTKEGGVSIRAERYMEDNREMLALRVIDTGIGIRPEDQQIIFDEFRQVDGSATREYGGTGLGLAITKRLIELMGGRIWVESALGKGSIFTILIPVATEANKQKEETSA
jgi:GAF domain-containing protein/anti-sigma regulatory factor (Ser/Thr protein kinase)